MGRGGRSKVICSFGLKRFLTASSFLAVGVISGNIQSNVASPTSASISGAERHMQGMLQHHCSKSILFSNPHFGALKSTIRNSKTSSQFWKHPVVGSNTARSIKNYGGIFNLELLRGGANTEADLTPITDEIEDNYVDVDEDEDKYEETESEEEDDQYKAETEDTDSYEIADSDEEINDTSKVINSNSVAADDDTVIQAQLFDKPIAPSALRNFALSMIVMVYTRRFDANNPHVVRAARIVYIGYLFVMQVFYIFVRIRARLLNNRDPITVENAMANIVKSQLNNAVSGRAGGGHEDTVKTIASRFLSSQTTIMEYDMQQANQMRNGMLFPLIMNWVLHFKFGQVQPLFLEVARGLLGLVESCLFQVYVLNRNLERPFKIVSPLEELQARAKVKNNGDSIVDANDIDDDRTVGSENTIEKAEMGEGNVETIETVLEDDYDDESPIEVSSESDDEE